MPSASNVVCLKSSSTPHSACFCRQLVHLIIIVILDNLTSRDAFQSRHSAIPARIPAGINSPPTTDTFTATASQNTRDSRVPMLQYALPKAPESFSRTSSVFAEPPSRTQPSSNSLDSRRSSATSQHSTEPIHTRSTQAHSQEIASSAQAEAQLQHLPALSALASLAASAPAATMNPTSTNGDRYVAYDVHEAGRHKQKGEVRCDGGLDKVRYWR